MISWRYDEQTETLLNGGEIIGRIEPASGALASAAPDLRAALEDLATVTRRSGIVTDEEIDRLEDRYGEDQTWGELVDAVNEAVRNALAKAGAA